MRSNNLVMLRGHLGAEPDPKILPSGDTVVDLRLATSHSWRTGTGEKRERTDWHRVSVWGRTADYCVRWLHKGDHVLVLGSIRNDVVEDQTGKRTYSSVKAHEVTNLRRTPVGSDTRQPGARPSGPQYGGAAQQYGNAAAQRAAPQHAAPQQQQLESAMAPAGQGRPPITLPPAPPPAVKDDDIPF